ncbi:MAG: PDC sensor domain-containing protein [gamma proteobacterium symbiont of Bathyaustriella thionipta]|nr:PDC sensor domain-containing protein [gamma proteobacterium symbiont of Bathyaustriella thionipta]
MSQALKKSIARQRSILYNMLLDPLPRQADQLAAVWPHKESLDRTLVNALPTIPWAKYLYVLDMNARQISDNISTEGQLPQDFGRDRSARPYIQEVTDEPLLLSHAFLSERANRPSVTALQKIMAADGQQLGFLGVDFDLRELPLTRELYEETSEWQQIKGDPAIRGSLFTQTRFESNLDKNIDLVLPIVTELLVDHGVFHAKIHFSSSRLTLWHIDDPFRYRLVNYEAMTDPEICLAYPMRNFPSKSLVPPQRIPEILATFRHLRFADSTIYLRAGSINLFNGIIGLNFSCDGSHYIPVHDFLARDSAFWRGLGGDE